jgi:hypothetical protein
MIPRAKACPFELSDSAAFYNGFMFFRRTRVSKPGFQERVDALQSAGFTVAPLPGGATRVTRGFYAVDLKESNGSLQVENRAGILFCGEIAVLVDGGYQKFFLTPSGKKKPALADELKGLHDFEADLKEKLGMASLYNEGLGTVSTLYQYDRVKDRDRGVAKRVWE